ncbi:MAG: hypothetical protein K8R99_02650 [Actinomycetia bacterium]|nr:hypothetical protein [Actinomycetes bacterium]
MAADLGSSPPAQALLNRVATDVSERDSILGGNTPAPTPAVPSPTTANEHPTVDRLPSDVGFGAAVGADILAELGVDDDQALQNEDGSILSEQQARARARDEVLIAALASGAAYSEAARQGGCGVRTVARRMRDDGFRRSVAEARDLWVTQTAGSLTALGPDAVAVLAEVMQDETTRYRLAAAQTVLTQGLRTRQHHELEAEVREIRAELDRLRNGVQS